MIRIDHITQILRIRVSINKRIFLPQSVQDIDLKLGYKTPCKYLTHKAVITSIIQSYHNLFQLYQKSYLNFRLIKTAHN